MKVLTLAFVMAAFCALSSDAGRCFSRKEKVGLRSLMMEMKCGEPMKQLVQLPVPEGFSSVVPNVQMVKRCSGLLCSGKNKGCMPTNEQKTTIKVEAWTSGDKHMKCTEVEVDEHFECGCECRLTEDDCSEYQVFDSKMCNCDKCREDAKTDCMNGKGGGGVWMFNTEDCTCTCADPSVCGSD